MGQKGRASGGGGGLRREEEEIDRNHPGVALKYGSANVVALGVLTMYSVSVVERRRVPAWAGQSGRVRTCRESVSHTKAF
jgi:hypothetical protein